MYIVKISIVIKPAVIQKISTPSVFVSFAIIRNTLFIPKLFKKIV